MGECIYNGPGEGGIMEWFEGKERTGSMSS